MMTTAKGITNGTVPCGAVFASRHVHDALMTGPEGTIGLFHGYTYSAHPTACAAGLATLDIYKDEGLLTRGASIARDTWRDALHSLKGLPNVIDIRNVGLMGAVEVAPRKEGVAARGYDVMVDCFNCRTLSAHERRLLCAVATLDRREKPHRRYRFDPRRRHQARGLILARERKQKPRRASPRRMCEGS